MKKLFLVSVAIFAMILAGCAPRTGTQVSGSSSAAGIAGSASGGNDTFGGVASLAASAGNWNTIYFDFDKYNIKPEMQQYIDMGANVLKGRSGNVQVSVDGHCDEWGTDEYNQALGLRRANAVKQALVTLGINSRQISVRSYGETQPVCTDRTAECDAKNRRAVINVGL